MRRKDPVFKDFPHMIYGGDYNPDQWLQYPEILKEDARLMKLAGINSASVGIFAWMALEPQEGVYTFDWLDETMDRIASIGGKVILATPSGARPAWMDKKYPEVLRVNRDRTKNIHGDRHNHCYTSPYYRKKVREMNTMLAERYKDHPALAMWHISNEYGGECHCPLCQQAFRDWLRAKYHNDISELNAQWWTGFWSKTYNDFDEIESPSPLGESAIHALNIDWMRFVTHQTTDFMENEIAAVKAVTPDIPVTTNLMGLYAGYDPWVLSKSLDVVSWDNYPEWHKSDDRNGRLASDIAFVHDLNRSLKQQPFLLMESTPSLVNWRKINKLKRPNMNITSSLQAVAHGADSVQYFQWRKGRGAFEKFHGAVVDHEGSENTRVFREAARLGEILKNMDAVPGTMVPVQAAVICDWDNRWAIDNMQGLVERKNYDETCRDHYYALWQQNIAADVIDSAQDFSPYRLLIAPMLYMLKPGVAKRLREFVEQGGTLVTTYVTGYVNENDLCFLGGFPGDGLKDVIGIWAEEIDGLWEDETRRIRVIENIESDTAARGQEPAHSTSASNGKADSAGESADSNIGKTYEARDLCELVHPLNGCKVLAVYDEDFYAGMPAVTVNTFGAGQAYHIAARTGDDMLFDFYRRLADELGISGPAGVLRVVDEKGEPVRGVSIRERACDGESILFFLNFTEKKVIAEHSRIGRVELEPYGSAVFSLTETLPE